MTPPSLSCPAVPSMQLLRFLPSHPDAHLLPSLPQVCASGRSITAAAAAGSRQRRRRCYRSYQTSSSPSPLSPCSYSPQSSPFSLGAFLTRQGLVAHHSTTATTPPPPPPPHPPPPPPDEDCLGSSPHEDDLDRRVWRQRLWQQLRGESECDERENGGGGGGSSRRSPSAHASQEPRIRCTEVDENGDMITRDGEFRKTELIARYGLLPRDLRKIDSSNLPHILVRQSAILLNLLHLRVLIRHDRVLLIDLYGSKSSYSQESFMRELQSKLRPKQQQQQPALLPYEFRALEVVLTSVAAALEADFESVYRPSIRILGELEDDVDRDKLRVLLILSKRVGTFEQRARLVRDAIEEVLEANDDLAAMYLTEKAHDVVRAEDDHTEVELLLESYHKLFDEIVQEASNLVINIRNTEEIIRAILDANRNSLMLLDLKFSVGTLGLATGTFIAGLYGMNLANFLEETSWGFGTVTGASIALSVVVCAYGLVKLRRVRRVKMMTGEAARHHQHDPQPQMRLMAGANSERMRRQQQQQQQQQHQRGEGGGGRRWR